MEIEIGRDTDILQAMQFVGNEFFPFDIPFVLDLDLGFLDDLGIHLLLAQKIAELR